MCDGHNHRVGLAFDIAVLEGFVHLDHRDVNDLLLESGIRFLGTQI